MRMWHKSLTPLLCNQHLLGAHNELHKHRHSFTKRHSITGRIIPVVQIEPYRMADYHRELVAEMISRGINHNSPYTMPDLSYLPKHERMARVSLKENIKTLTKRCLECKRNIKGRKG